MTISRSNIPKQVTTGGRKMMKKKGYRAGGMMKTKGMRRGGKVKTKAMKKGGPTMTIAKLRAAAKKKGYKLVKA
jgi:hypothetical protein|tara:strand:+ start:392 stop:613 length:222 start_codon:yes stop_codon:yes gene_type:complete